jgi:hypothetical protein
MRLLIAGYALQIKQTVSRVKYCPLSALGERGCELTGEKILSQGSNSVTESRSASGSQIDSLIPKTISSIPYLSCEDIQFPEAQRSRGVTNAILDVWISSTFVSSGCNVIR